MPCRQGTDEFLGRVALRETSVWRATHFVAKAAKRRPSPTVWRSHGPPTAGYGRRPPKKRLLATAQTQRSATRKKKHRAEKRKKHGSFGLHALDFRGHTTGSAT